jgi:polyvinyl alcohol dehydrogenase (cytochrome)
MKGQIRVGILGLLIALFCSAQEGSQVFTSKCLQCHSPTSATHAPAPEALTQIPWREVLKTLETGAMKAQAQSLSADDKIAVARFIGKPGGSEVLPQVTDFCAAGVKPSGSKACWNSWAVDEINTRFQPASAAGLAANDVPSLKVKRAFGFPTGRTAYGQPAVVGGLVCSGSNDGTI